MVAAVVLVAFIVGGADPILQLFTWLSGLSAVGVVALMAGTSAAVVGFFRKHQTDASLWQRVIAPVLATLVLGALVVLLIANFDSLIGDAESPLRWVLPALVILAAIAGLIWGLVLRAIRPDVYQGIGNVALAPEEDEQPQVDLPALPHHRR